MLDGGGSRCAVRGEILTPGQNCLGFPTVNNEKASEEWIFCYKSHQGPRVVSTACCRNTAPQALPGTCPRCQSSRQACPLGSHLTLNTIMDAMLSLPPLHRRGDCGVKTLAEERWLSGLWWE